MSDEMKNKSKDDLKSEDELTIEEIENPWLILETKGRLAKLFIFLIALTLETLGFFVMRLSIARGLGQEYIAVDILTMIVLVIGAFSVAYWYYTRYVKRRIIFGEKKFQLDIGKHSYQYDWSDFSLVALTVSPSHAGIKGYMIRVYEKDLDSEYVDIPLYRFPLGDLTHFKIREMIEEAVKKNKKREKKKENHNE